MDYSGMFMIVGIIVVFSIIMSMIYKNKEKVDKGFVLNGFRLSYRRRMIRSLITIPFVVIGFILLYVYEYLTFGTLITFLAIGAVAYAFEVGYNYRMWKKSENEMNNVPEQ